MKFPQKNLRIGGFEKLNFFLSQAILEIFLQKEFYCFISMKIDQI